MSFMFYYTCPPEHMICFFLDCAQNTKKKKSKTKRRTKNKKKNKQNVNKKNDFYVWGLLFQLFISEGNKKYILCSRLTFLPNKC